jgi:AcrR family transcriptional regulator
MAGGATPRATVRQVARATSSGDDAVRAALLVAAQEVLAKEGAAALTVRRIAAEAGVSTMNVYSRFGGKEGVVNELRIAGYRRLADYMVDDDDADDDDAEEALHRCGEAYRRFAQENPTSYAVMFDDAVPDMPWSEEAVAVADATLDVLAAKLQRAMAAGILAPADPLETAAYVWATCHGLVSLEMKQMGGPRLDWPAIFERGMALMHQGLRHPAVGPAAAGAGPGGEG